MAIFGLALLAAAPAAGQDRPTWRIVEQTGEVELISTGAQPIALAGTTALGRGDRIRTGSDGRVVLRRGDDMVIVAPNSTVQLPAAGESAFSRIVQLLGSIFVRIEHRGDDAFEVRTPFLVAVVKGTVFTVSTGAASGEVHVAQGLVEVRDPSSGMTYSLSSGQAIQLGGGNAPLPRSRDTTAASLPSSARVARDVAASTGGLLSLEVTQSSSGDATAATNAASIEPPPGIADIAPSAGVLRGLGGNRARGGALPPAPAPAPPRSGSGGGTSGGGGGTSGGSGGTGLR